MNAIECRDLTKYYQGFTLDHITFSLPSGSILGLVGENGAGKSTTLNLLMNALPRDGGTVCLLGTDNQSPEFLQTKQDIGVVLDDACLPEAVTPMELGRKLAIAAALSHHAKLLLLDEATSGLDPMVREEVLDAFNEFTREEDHTVVFSSHIVSDLEKICDYIAFLHRGKLVLFAEKDQLLEEYAVVKLSPQQLSELDAAAIVGKKEGPYGAEALVRRKQIPPQFVAEHTNLEDVILFFARQKERG